MSSCSSPASMNLKNFYMKSLKTLLFRVDMKASLHSYDSLNHWPKLINSNLQSLSTLWRLRVGFKDPLR
jgi:hypothetical protein